MLQGVAPNMSVSTSTPSPSSSCAHQLAAPAAGSRRDRRARSRRAGAPAAAACRGRGSRSGSALSPRAPCEIIDQRIADHRVGIRLRRALAAFSSASMNMPATSNPVWSLDLAKAGRAGDVDLGEPVADHVQAHQQQPARARAPGRAPRRSPGRAPTAAAPRRCRRRRGCRATRPASGCARAQYGTGLPSISRMRLSPSRISGM